MCVSSHPPPTGSKYVGLGLKLLIFLFFYSRSYLLLLIINIIFALIYEFLQYLNCLNDIYLILIISHQINISLPCQSWVHSNSGIGKSQLV